MGLQFLFMDDNAPCHRTVAAEQLLESEDIERMDWPERSPDLKLIGHVWEFLGRRLAARTLPPVTIRDFRLALQDEWAAMPQQLIDTVILSMGRRYEEHTHSIPKIHGGQIGHHRERGTEAIGSGAKVQHGGHSDHDPRGHSVDVQPEADEGTRHQDDSRTEHGAEVEDLVASEHQKHTETTIVSYKEVMRKKEILEIYLRNMQIQEEAVSVVKEESLENYRQYVGVHIPFEIQFSESIERREQLQALELQG
ncbi:transposable element Tcb2 transposase [Trichonephila clavipes]|nr:transposable element Tcb2 transposase [Trichonephila clavipes]